MKNLTLIVLTVLLASSCKPKQSEPKVIIEETPQLVSEVMTKEKQDALTPISALNDLIEGNERFISGEMIRRDNLGQLSQLTKGQYPKAVVLSCIDSRVPVEQIFDQGIGDIFVVRIAGNIDDEFILGSLEYSCKVSGTKILMVMGHESCGAVKSAIQGVELGNITVLLEDIQETIQNSDFEGERKYSNPAFMEYTVKANAEKTIDDIREKSPLLKEMEDNGEIKMVGAYFELETGKISILE